MQLDEPEKPEPYFELSDECFPFTAQLPSKFKYFINSWDDLAEALANPKYGRTQIQHARDLRIRVGKKWKSISLESIARLESVSWFLALYSRARAKYIKGYLFPGELQDQPHILYGIGQAFDVIATAISDAKLENIRTLRKQEKQQNG